MENSTITNQLHSDKFTITGLEDIASSFTHSETSANFSYELKLEDGTVFIGDLTVNGSEITTDEETRETPESRDFQFYSCSFDSMDVYDNDGGALALELETMYLVEKKIENHIN